jgi:hypothetical protein
MWFDKKLPMPILVIPFLWSIIGSIAALKLGIHEDTGLLVAGILGTLMTVYGMKKVNYSIYRSKIL